MGCFIRLMAAPISLQSMRQVRKSEISGSIQVTRGGLSLRLGQVRSFQTTVVEAGVLHHLCPRRSSITLLSTHDFPITFMAHCRTAPYGRSRVTPKMKL